MHVFKLLCILGCFRCLRTTNPLFTLLFFAMGHGSPHNSLFLLCKIEQRGVIRVRIRCRVIRIRVRRACIRTIVRVTASGTHAKTYHAVRFRQLPNVAARCFCSFKIFARLRRGWGSHSRSHPPPPLWASMLFVSYDLAYCLGRGDCRVGLKIAERRGVRRARTRSRVMRIRARRDRKSTRLNSSHITA